MSAALCPDCGAAQLSSAVVPVGGQAVREPLPNQQSKFCYGCGGAMHVAAFDCPKCGAPQRLASPARPAKDRTAAILLAFFLGGIGAHKFYLGQPGLGILYLLFCWTLVPGLVALIEGLIYIGTHDADFQCKYS